METDWYPEIFILFLSLLLMAFISASELTILSLDKKKLKKNFQSNSITLRYLQSLLDNSGRLLLTFQIIRIILYSAAGVTSAVLSMNIAALLNLNTAFTVIAFIIFLTVIFFISSELIPRLISEKSAIKYARISVGPLYWIYVLFYPVVELFQELIQITKSFLRKINIASDYYSENSDKGITEGMKIQRLDTEEKEIIESIMDFRTLTVREIMTPRVDIKSISIDSHFEEIFEFIVKSGHSRIPVHNNDLDQISGILYAKDLIPYLMNEKLRKHTNLTKILREPMFVPASKMVNDLLVEFQEKKLHIAIVVDEYGGTAGIVSLEDIIEEAVGEIRDEFDKEEIPVVKLSENAFQLLGKVSIDQLNELTSSDFSSDEFDTVGGLVLNQAGSVPYLGYAFELNGYKFTVSEIIRKRIKKVTVEKILK
ncbi:MAG: HlyC/CorC family transporter [Ignavibacteriaceae bacterium]|nr:HlyC/CorC family transporter [Ignavibacteriaceae bacterium]